MFHRNVYPFKCSIFVYLQMYVFINFVPVYVYKRPRTDAQQTPKSVAICRRNMCKYMLFLICISVYVYWNTIKYTNRYLNSSSRVYLCVNVCFPLCISVPSSATAHTYIYLLCVYLYAACSACFLLCGYVHQSVNRKQTF